MRRFRPLLALPLLLVAAVCSRRAEPKAESLLLVVIDTLRQDRVGAYGSTAGLTPVLDRLALEGAKADGIAPSSWTKPSVATLLTGLHPIRHQLMGKTDLFPGSVVLLAERLRAAGYSTAAISPNAHVAPAWGFDRGFDRFVSFWRETGERFPSSARINERVEGLLAGLEPPFFLYVHYLDPHHPWAPATLAGGAPLPAELAELVPLRLPAGRERPGNEVPPDRLAAARTLYDAEVWESDAALGALIAMLRRHALDDRLLTVVVSDHGEEFLEHGRIGHGFDLYEETVRVPLVVHAPGVVPAGTAVGEMGLDDVVPTVLDLLGVERPRDPAAFDGRSRAAELRGEAVSETPRRRLLHLDATESPVLALRSPAGKLVLGAEPYVKELFDLAADPAERANLVRDAGVHESFADLARALAADYGVLSARAPIRRRGSADAELLDNLVALGYLDLRRSGDDRRYFPHRLEPADARVGGLRGWEDAARFLPCFEATAAPTGQLLMGWSLPIPGEAGVWALAEASFALPIEPGARGVAGEVEISGRHWGRAPMDLTVRVDGAVALEKRLEPGPVRLTVSLPPAEGAPLRIVRFDARPPHRPREGGADDPRDLSIFVERICWSSAPDQRR